MGTRADGRRRGGIVVVIGGLFILGDGRGQLLGFVSAREVLCGLFLRGSSLSTGAGACPPGLRLPEEQGA